MAKFLTTSGTSYYLEQLILNASSQLVLVTPFLRLSQNFIERLRDADSNGIHIILIYGKSKLKQNEWYLLSELKNIDIYFCQNLHAKCYQNDDALIISSMNLYQFSQENNREMSILIERDSDEEVYEDVSDEIQSIINASVLKKSSGRMEGNSENISLDPDYTDRTNFHIPYLLKLLQTEYSGYSFDIKDHPGSVSRIIAANDFPKLGINLKVEDRILFNFENEHQQDIWYEKKPELYDKLTEAKVYVDTNVIKLYWRNRTTTFVSDENLQTKADAYLNIIKKTVNVLK